MLKDSSSTSLTPSPIFNLKLKAGKQYQIPYFDDCLEILKLAHEIDQSKPYAPWPTLVKEVQNIGYNWNGLNAMAKSFIAECTGCNSNRLLSFPALAYEAGSLKSSKPLERMQVDLISLNPKIANYKFILTAKDHFSRVADARLLKNKKAKSAKEAIEGIFQQWGFPEIIQTDNGLEFKAEFEAFIKSQNIKIIRGRPCHPQSQGSVEKFNGYFKGELKNKIDKHKKNPNFRIEDTVAEIIHVYNHIRIHETIEDKPINVFRIKNPEELKEIKFKIETNKNKKAKKVIIPTFLLITSSFLRRNE